MSNSIINLFRQLKIDDWRSEVGFSPEIEEANEKLFAPTISEAEANMVFNDWLAKHQPCLFGRLAAKKGLLSYCVLTEQDLEDNETIRNKIQSARTAWTAEGFDGKKSGFLIVLLSKRIALALPDPTMMEIARQVCSLYLLSEIEIDKIYTEQMFLEIPGRKTRTYTFNAGINYFCSQGDRRWWQDHRFPGGMAFSVNSVAHMAKSGMLAKLMQDLEAIMRVPQEGWVQTKVDSLEKALELAMRTISIASEGVSGRATELLPLPADKNDLVVKTCPITLPSFLRDKNFCSYRGYYHTDFTLPSEYFLPDIERPTGLKVHELDFTYLFDRSIDNPEFITMGEGRQIRHGTTRPKGNKNRDVNAHLKQAKGRVERMAIKDSARLSQALRGR